MPVAVVTTNYLCYVLIHELRYLRNWAHKIFASYEIIPKIPVASKISNYYQNVKYRYCDYT